MIKILSTILLIYYLIAPTNIYFGNIQKKIDYAKYRVELYLIENNIGDKYDRR